MNDVSGDEAIVLLLSAVVTGRLGLRFIGALLGTDRRSAPLGLRAMLFTAPLCGLLFIHFVVVRWAEPQVRAHSVYIVLFVLLGGAWLGAVVSMLPLLGLSLRDDALENANPAAAVAVCGAMLGTSLCYAGCNIGGGETIWSTILPALLATAVLLAMWFVIEIGSRVSDAITIDRDGASALRLAGWLVAAGAILGRAMAGDYVTAEATLRDFVRQGWPAAVLAIMTIVTQWMLTPTPRRPKLPILWSGFVPALVLILLATGWIVSRGWWTANGGMR